VTLYNSNDAACVHFHCFKLKSSGQPWKREEWFSGSREFQSILHLWEKFLTYTLLRLRIRFKFAVECFWLLYPFLIFPYEYFVFLGRVTNPSAKPPFLEDQFVSLSLASLLRPVRLGRPYQEQEVPAGIARKVIEARKTLPRQGRRMDNTRLPKHALNYKPRGRRERGRPRKRWQCVDTGTGQTT